MDKSFHESTKSVMDKPDFQLQMMRNNKQKNCVLHSNDDNNSAVHVGQPSPSAENDARSNPPVLSSTSDSAMANEMQRRCEAWSFYRNLFDKKKKRKKERKTERKTKKERKKTD